MKHSFCEGNRCADMMAKVVINHVEQDTRIIVPLVDVVELLKEDLIGSILTWLLFVFYLPFVTKENWT